MIASSRSMGFTVRGARDYHYPYHISALPMTWLPARWEPVFTTELDPELKSARLDVDASVCLTAWSETIGLIDHGPSENRSLCCLRAVKR